MKFVYPVKKQNYDENYFSFQYGSFPISTFNVWHGGVHLEAIEGELQPISDGRIIAYNFPDQYKEPCVDGTTVQYSDGFLLLQHDYQSQNTQKIRYYSLYHHIASKQHINGSPRLSPPFFVAEQKTIVTAENYPLGVRGRSSDIEEGKTRGREIAVIPQHYIVTRNDDTKLAEWAVKYNKGKSKESKKYYSYTFTDPITNTIYNDIHIYSNCLEKTEEGKYKVKSYNKETNSVTRKGNKNITTPVVNPDIKPGIVVYEKKSTQSRCIGLISKDTEVTVIEGQKDTGVWVQLVGYEGYVNKNGIKQQNQFKKDVKFDTVVACDIPVKAGETIGYVGKFGFVQKPTYDTTHFEIFTDQDITNFLIDKKEDGKDVKKHYKLTEGATLEPNMATAMTVKAKTPITITKTKGDYRKVKVISETQQLTKGVDIVTGKKLKDPIDNIDKRYSYTIPKEKLAYVGKLFGRTFTKTDLLYFKGYVTDENSNQRYVYYVPDHFGKEFWIHKNRISNACDVGENGRLHTDINEVYKDEPVITDGNPITVEKDTSIVKIFKKHTDSNGDLWYYIQCKYMIDHKTVTKKGWIKECDTHLGILNPFNWRDFGFKTLEAGSDYVFDIKGYNKKEDTCDFVQEIWGNLDTTEDQVLDSLEIKRAYRNPRTRDQITKLICKHKSEWSYDPATIKQEAEQYYQIGISQEKRTDKKQQLINKKNALLDALQERVNNLMWWDKVQSAQYDPPPPPPDPEEKKKPENKYDFGTSTIDHETLSSSLSTSKNTGNTNDYSLPLISEMNVDLVTHSKTATTTPEVETKEEQKPERTLPSTDSVWHFHPIAFIRQMRLMFEQETGECHCNKDFTAEDLKRIITYVRYNTFYKDAKGRKQHISLVHKDDMLFHGSHDIPSSDQNNYERLAEVLNASFAKRGITKCSHKIHYLANMYVETQYFSKLEESGNNHRYMPYKGRGFIHITHDYNYKAYSDVSGHENIVSGTNYKKVTSSLELAADTGSWFWQKNKVNEFAEKDDIFGTSKKINAPNATKTSQVNGYKMRRSAWIKFKEAFNNYPYNCVTDASENPREYGEGVLEEMRKWADQHVQYKQESEWIKGIGITGLRTSQTKDAVGRLDCTEFVCRYLHKLGVTDTVKVITTGTMVDENLNVDLNRIKKDLGTNNIEHILNSHKQDFVPIPGDFFLWRTSGGGHVGIVHSVDGDNITILEAIGRGGSSDENHNRNSGGYEGYNCTRTSVYQRTGRALAGHAGWKGYFRPKNYTKKL